MERQGMETLSGRRILISGGTTGIGRALVDKLVDVGAQVATFAREERPIQELQQAHPQVKVYQGDLSNPEDVKSVLSRAVSDLGGLDALVNNAAIGGESITSMAYEDWKPVIDINLIGCMHLTQLSLEHLGEGSKIIIVGSMSAKVREAESDVYVATKSGLRGFSDSLAKVLSPKGINVTLIEPGLAESDMTTEDKTDQEVAEAKRNDEMMDPEDVARMIVFTLSQPSHIAIGELQIRPRAQLI